MAASNVQLILVGNSNAGKTTLLYRFATGNFPQGFTPPWCDSSYRMTVDSKPVRVLLADTAGGERYPLIRHLDYRGKDAFLLCFAVDDRRSFEDCPEYWLPEIRHHCPDRPVLLVGCKSDLVKTSPDICITEEEIKLRKKEWGNLPYIETSALAPMCVSDCFAMAVRVVWQDREQREFEGRRHKFKSGMISSVLEWPYIHIPSSKPPSIAVDSSEYCTHWAAALENPENDDVTFFLHTGVEVYAHAVMLAASSSFFSDVIGSFDTKDSLTTSGGDGTNGIMTIKQDLKTRRTDVYLQETISENAFICALQFLYTGLLPRPKMADGITIEQMKSLSVMWNIPYLSSVCENIENEDDNLNPSIGTYLNQETCGQFKKMYLNSEDRADVFFQVEGLRIPAHRAILSARCPVLAAMLSGRFKEGSIKSEDVVIQDVSYASFLALLEYIYTDTAPVEDGDAVAIMAVADQFCQSRLVTLCEIYITKNTQKLLDTDMKNSTAYVIDLFNLAQRYNAQQMERWCLHGIAMNYEEFQPDLADANLSAGHLAYIEEHR